MIGEIPEDWRMALGDRLLAVDMQGIRGFVATERAAGQIVYPPDDQVFAALALTPFDSVRAVILGQDPYHRVGQPHGLAFSTLASEWPPTLGNILLELQRDCRWPLPASGSLRPWAEHGVLLLNTVLTVGEKAGSHKGNGWEELTAAVIDAMASKRRPIAFVLWGGHAIHAGRKIDRDRHVVVQSSHPSPLSVRRPCGDAPRFEGSRPFTAVNAGLRQRSAQSVDWRLSPAWPPRG